MNPLFEGIPGAGAHGVVVDCAIVEPKVYYCLIQLKQKHHIKKLVKYAFQ